MATDPGGDPLWQPLPERMERANLTRYLRWLADRTGRRLGSYRELWDWSVSDLEGFWGSLWEFFEIISHQPPAMVLAERRMPGAVWFPGARLNYAEHALRRRDEHPSLIYQPEDGPPRTLTYAELHRATAAAANGLRRLGVTKGDRVVGVLPNIPEAVVALLATASLGAIWSSCPPEFGTTSVVERFRQIEPKVLVATDGYRYRGRVFDRRAEVAELRGRLPSLAATVSLPMLDHPVGPGLMSWDELTAEPAELLFEPVPFDHPLWVLYSSGTTGMPKAIVHGHGGILVEHHKMLSFHLDLTATDRFFWFTTTGWMMWNFLVGGLLLGSTVLLYDGDPAYPDLRRLWRFAEQTEMTYFGISAAFIQASLKAGIDPGSEFDLHRLRGVGSTGSPLSPEGFHWIYDHVGSDLVLGSMSGGTDVCTAFVAGCPLLPVVSGEIQCRALGAKVEAFDHEGRAVIDQVGELVLTEPLPSMPLYFWNDPEGHRLEESYYSNYPGVWRHGDWIRITPRGSCLIYGRSDSTLNRGGVRMGTAEFYQVVEDLSEVTDSLVIDTGRLGREGRLLLFVVLAEGAELDEDLTARIRAKIKTDLSPRHVPDEIHRIEAVPRTLTGKKLEVPVRRVLTGAQIADVASEDAMANPDSMEYFVTLGRFLAGDD